MKLASDDLHEIETAAVELLESYFSTRPDHPRVPTPLEYIVESHLGLAIVHMDLKQQLGNPLILGALNVEGGEVWIDRALDPYDFPGAEGCYRFTLAHELGHWCLHRHENLEPASFTFRRDRREEIREKEANAFAAAVLMPRLELCELWQALYGDARVHLSDLQIRREEVLEAATVQARKVPVTYRGTQDLMLEWAVREVAELFEVSAIAMRIRCEQLELVIR